MRRRKGTWKVVQRYKPTDKMTICECSICHDTLWVYDDARKWNYCPNCGAEMSQINVEQKKGKWRYHCGALYCDVCHVRCDDISPFCPHCGADMIGDKYNG